MAGERLPGRAPVRPRLRGVSHRGPDGDELEVLALALMAPFEPDANDTVGAKRVRFGLHARHRIPACAVGRLGQHG